MDINEQRHKEVIYAINHNKTVIWFNLMVMILIISACLGFTLTVAYKIDEIKSYVDKTTNVINTKNIKEDIKNRIEPLIKILNFENDFTVEESDKPKWKGFDKVSISPGGDQIITGTYDTIKDEN